MRRLFGLVVLTILVVSLHLAATRLYLYYTTWWADVVLHFIGGAWMAIAASTLAKAFNRELSLNRAIIFTFIAGIGWEIFEYEFDLIAFSDWLDSSIDLAMDLIGAYVVFWIFRLPRAVPSKTKTV